MFKSILPEEVENIHRNFPEAIAELEALVPEMLRERRALLIAAILAESPLPRGVKEL